MPFNLNEPPAIDKLSEEQRKRKIAQGLLVVMCIGFLFLIIAYFKLSQQYNQCALAYTHLSNGIVGLVYGH